MIKIILKILIYIIIISSVSVFGTEHYEFEYNSNSISWNYELYKVSDNFADIILHTKLKNKSYSTSNGKIWYDITPSSKGLFFRYPNIILGSEDYIFKMGGQNLEYIGLPDINNPIISDFTKYRTTEISNEICSPMITTPICNNGYCTINVYSNLNQLMAGTNTVTYLTLPIHKDPNNPIEHLLEKYYYMKTVVKANLFKEKIGGDINIGQFFPTGTIDVSSTTNLASKNYFKYNLLKPDSNEFTFNLPTDREIYGKFGVGNYYWQFVAQPVDLKCDFDGNKSLEYNQISNQEAKIGITPALEIAQPIGLTLLSERISSEDDIIKKLKYDYANNKTYFEETQITLPETQANKVKIYKNNVLTRNESINPILIGLNLHKLINLKDKGQIENKITQSYNLMNTLEIEKHIDNTSNPGFTNIKIKMKFPSNDMQNITLYQVLPKSVLENFDDLKIINNGSSLNDALTVPVAECSQYPIGQIYDPTIMLLTTTSWCQMDCDPWLDLGQTPVQCPAGYVNCDCYGDCKQEGIDGNDCGITAPTTTKTNLGQYFINDKDPVIGWYFNYSDEDIEIEYELPGNNEGGTIIITQEPILFNEGDLIINYRENGCEPGEADLFGLEDLYESEVLSSGGFYRVCVAHKTEILEANTNNNFKHIFNYTDTKNMSLTQTLTESVDISVNNAAPMYWNIVIQKENPTGDYSCLGSFENQDSSYFGDCGYIQNNRIWIHLGNDVVPPTTTLEYPSIAHTVRVTLNAEDGFGTGVKDTFYCVGEDCDPTTEYSGMFLISCDNQWACDKEINYYSTDIAGNIEETKTTTISLIELGSACESSCLGAPSPNRYINSCNNLNNCNYYDINSSGINDDGIYVSNICHMLTQNSWAKYNNTHDIMCPEGPFAKSALTSENIDFSQSDCDEIRIDKYNVLINGEMAIMKIVTCETK